MLQVGKKWGNGPCWHHFEALVYDGSAAMCTLPEAPRVRSMPSNGCSGFEREPGSDDEDAPLLRQVELGDGIGRQMR